MHSSAARAQPPLTGVQDRIQDRIREATMTNANPKPLKLSKLWNGLLREENQRVIEFFLMLALICSATTLAGLGVLTRVDSAFRTIGTTFSSYMR